MKKNVLITLFVSLVSLQVFAAGDALDPKQMKWSFDGIRGKLDRPSAQRGFQVYKEVCSSCHSIKRMSFRHLEEIGFSVAEIKSLSSTYDIIDGPNDDGEMFDRLGKPSDAFPLVYPNEKAARSANNGALPPDLSLMVKARPDGANYLYSLLTGYEKAPEGVKISEGLHYNPYFPGGQIAMIPPLSDDAVEYGDGTKATVEQMSHDLVNFLQWTAEPEMEQRNSLGIQTMIYLAIFTLFFYFAMKRLWARVK